MFVWALLATALLFLLYTQERYRWVRICALAGAILAMIAAVSPARRWVATIGDYHPKSFVWAEKGATWGLSEFLPRYPDDVPACPTHGTLQIKFAELRDPDVLVDSAVFLPIGPLAAVRYKMNGSPIAPRPCVGGLIFETRQEGKVILTIEESFFVRNSWLKTLILYLLLLIVLISLVRRRRSLAPDLC
jgi:hypothetical protein